MSLRSQGARSVWRRWPIRLLLAAAVVILLLRVASGLLLDTLVTWRLDKNHRDGPLLGEVILRSPLLFGHSALPALGRIVDDQPRFALEAYSAIARLGPPRATRLLDERAATLPVGQAWWQPPEPAEELLNLLASGAARRTEATVPGAVASRWRIPLANSCLFDGPDGSPLVIFNHPYLGGDRDLWLYRLAEPSSEAVFLGALLGREFRDHDLHLECLLVEDDVVQLAWSLRDEPNRIARLPPPAALIWLPEASADSDEDGLSDRVERRLLTDPLARDTDGDGVGPGGFQPQRRPAGGAGVAGCGDRRDDADVLHPGGSGLPVVAGALSRLRATAGALEPRLRADGQCVSE